MKDSRRRTKIIWSLSRRSLTDEHAEIIRKGRPDALRLIYSAGSENSILTFLDKISTSGGHPPFSIMIDVATSPRARIGEAASPREFVVDEQVTLSLGEKGPGIPIWTDEIDTLVKPGATVFFGYGDVRLQVESVKGTQVECRVLQGGAANPKMELHVPETRKLPSLANLTDINIGALANRGIDYVVLPGLINAKEISIARKKIETLGGERPWLLLKVDHKDVYENLGELISHIDGVIISRRELALTLEPATIPMITKEIIQLCNDNAKLVITASEILGSMRQNPTPTRAEVSDIANCVMDGADAVLLTEDISRGPYLLKALDVCTNVILDIEKQPGLAINWRKEAPPVRNELDAVASQAYQTASRLDAKAIACLTKHGTTALKLSSFRQSKPVIAVTYSDQVNRHLALVRGVECVKLDVDPSLDEVLPAINDLLKRNCGMAPGDKFIFVTVTLSPVGREASNLFTVQHVV
jgi:pyruvate kinase